MIYLKVLLVCLSVTLTLATTNYDVISRGRKPELRELRPGNFETFRLPNDTRPLTYDISLRTWIDERNLIFTGTVRIGIIAVESTNTITLHHSDLTIENVLLLSEGGDTIQIGDVSYDSVFEFLTIPVSNNLTVGNEYVIVIDYRGILRTSTIGFYAIEYINSEGNGVYYASTQFESTSARHGFPCYDEIGIKAQFTIRITHDPSYSAVSTMPAISENPIQNPDGSVTTEFQQTPLMSTTVLAFHISDFANASSSAASVPHRVLSRPQVVNLTSRALRISELMLDAYSEHFGVDFVLPKMDSLSLPVFGGAMENFGLIAYGDYYMLYDPNIDDLEKEFTQVEIVAHEQAHQWFGNLVTISWWTYTWMKEGFATLFHNFGIDLIHPDWNGKENMLVTNVHRMFRFEANYMNNRPMTHYVEQTQEIDSLFDDVSYSKAASVLRMFLYAFGEETFMDGLRAYLDVNKFSTVTEQHLFDAMELTIWLENLTIIPSTTNVTAIMSSWTRQAGLPLVTVQRNYNAGTTQVTLSQARYFNPEPEEPYNTTYWIPYNYATPSNPGFNSSRVMGWIQQGQATVTITVNSLDADDYFMLDTYAGGYYRILYDARNYRLISDAMTQNPDHFTVLSKASLLENVHEFYNTQLLTMTTVMDVLRILENEANYVAWVPIQDFLPEIDRLFSGHQNYATYRDFIRTLVEGLYDLVGVEDVPDEPIRHKRARLLALNLACSMGSVHCRSDAVRQLRHLITNGGEFHQNIRRQLYCAALRSANSNDLNFVWNRMLESQNVNQRSELSQALGCLTSRILINRLLRSLLPSTNENNVEYQYNEAYNIFRSIYENSADNLDLALDFVLENAREAFETFSLSGANFLINMAQSIRRNDIIAKYRELLAFYVDEGIIAYPIVYVVEEVLAENRYLFEEHAPVINQWLLANFA